MVKETASLNTCRRRPYA